MGRGRTVARVVGGVSLAALGLWLVLLELGMAVSERHALRGTNVLFFLAALLAGAGVACLGFRLLRRR